MGAKNVQDNWTPYSPRAQGMHGGSLDRSSGVIRRKQESWNVWPHGRTAAAGGIVGWNIRPSDVKERSLLHIKHFCPRGSGVSSEMARSVCTINIL